MKTFVVTKKRDGQSAKEVYDIYANSLEEAKNEFKSKMTSDDLFYDEKTGTYTDECGNEVWGFSNDNMKFSEDVYTWELIEK